jgi:hypothetical protein
MGRLGLAQIFVALAGVVLVASIIAMIGYKWVLPADLARKSQRASLS